MKKTAYYVEFPTFWGRRGKLVAGLAARADANVRYITTHISRLVKMGLLPKDHGLGHGDQFAVLLEGTFLQFKVNRKDGASAAVHLPAAFEMPTADSTGFHSKEYDVTILGPMSQARLVTSQDGHLADVSVSPATENEATPDTTLTCFEILGVPDDSTVEDAKLAFRTLAKIHHPDVGGSDESMATINNAFCEAMAEIGSRNVQTPQE